MKEELTEIRKKLSKVLKKERFEHTIGVMYTAASLAMRYGADMEQALTAGLLHDCGKFCSAKDQLKLCEKKGIELTESERAMPALIHAKLGAYLARHEYGIKDEAVLNAIILSRTGRRSRDWQKCADLRLQISMRPYADQRARQQDIWKAAGKRLTR